MFLVPCSKSGVLEVGNHICSLALSVITPTASILHFSLLILHSSHMVKKKAPDYSEAFKNWHRHTLPGFRPSTICAGGLNFSVRNGKR